MTGSKVDIATKTEFNRIISLLHRRLKKRDTEITRLKIKLEWAEKILRYDVSNSTRPGGKDITREYFKNE